MHLTRRKFLATLTGGSAVISLGGYVPEFLAQAAAGEPAAGKDTILVVVQLTGGNDGLNTVVPYNHAEYRKARPKLAIPASDVLKINDTIGAPSVGPWIFRFVGRRKASDRARGWLSGTQSVPFRIDGRLAHLPAQGKSAHHRLVGTVSRCVATSHGCRCSRYSRWL